MSGSGKTISIRLLFQTAVNGFKRGVPRRALVYDAKGDWPGIVAGVTAGWQDPPPVKKLNPFDADGYGYDFQSDFTRSRNPASKAANFAKTLIPDSALGTDKSSTFFTSAGQLVLHWVTLLLHERAKRWTARDIIVAASDSRLVEVLFDRDDRARAVLNEFRSTPVTYANVLQTVASFLWQLEPAALAWEHHLANGRRLTFRDWFDGEDILILSGTDENPAAVEPINALLLEFFRQELRNRPEHPWYLPDVPETWLFLDEFQQIHPLPHLVDFFTLSRSKGATQCIGLQEATQLFQTYGEHVANTILGQCGYVGVMKLNSPATTSYFEKRIGSFEELMTFHQSGMSVSDNSPAGRTTTTTDGTSEQLITRPGVLAQEFTQLGEVGPGLWVDGVYIANGPYERRLYSAKYGACPLLDPARGFQNFRPLEPASITRPRAFSRDDFDRLGIGRDEIPADYFGSQRAKPPRIETLRELVKGWDPPPESSTSDGTES
jgi:type IV secretory pathway TraG/TraD family ATPase VirD4